jgi:short-subunit dehydrogenase
MKSFVLITGAAGGLGKAFAVECASRGWNLFLTDLRKEALEEFSEALARTYSIKVLCRFSDLTEHASRQELFEYIANEKIQFWNLINVAGLDFEGTFSKRTPSQIRDILRLNIEANLEVTYEILKHRDTERRFRIINVSSLAAFYPMPEKAMYAASKRFLLDFSLALREEIRHFGGTVTALCPAGLPTTEGSIRGINAQGFVGRITTKNVGYVASKTVDKALRGQAIYIPGFINQVLKFAGSFISPIIIARLIGKRWEDARRKSGVYEI